MQTDPLPAAARVIAHEGTRRPESAGRRVVSRGVLKAGLGFILALSACGTTTAADVPGTDATTTPATTTAAPTTETETPIDGAGGEGGSDGGNGAGAGPVIDCWDNTYQGDAPVPDYASLEPNVGDHCLGTDHQTIESVERIVFLGDSITVGTPPTAARNYYRAELAARLANRFDLEPPGLTWRVPNPVTRMASQIEDGAFASCARWGARAADVVDDQLDLCFESSDFNARTLVVITVGGNDMQDATALALDGAEESAVAARVDAMIAAQTAAVEWLTAPGRFPRGVFAIAANVYEFTDGTGTWDGCDVSPLVGFDKPLPAPELILNHIRRANLASMRTAVDTQTDIVFAHEHFCGHGFQAANPEAPCYRGAGVDRWFDLTCIHPNRRGHEELATMFEAVVAE